MKRIRVGAVLAAIIAVLAAACSNGGGSAAAPGSSSASGSAAYRQALTYAQCIRTHGAPDLPDPDSDGSFSIPSSMVIPQSATQACARLQPTAGLPGKAQRQQIFGELLRAAQCVRVHGFPAFPDPKEDGGSTNPFAAPSGPPPGIDLNSPRFQAVLSSCRKQYLGSSDSSAEVATAPGR
ncbi:MAG TPA: hypothetical protein VF070_35300 [Streptosporangiaceae bacterium]